MQHMVKIAKKQSESGRSFTKEHFQGSKVGDRNSMNDSGHFSKESLPNNDRPLSKIKTVCFPE